MTSVYGGTARRSGQRRGKPAAPAFVEGEHPRADLRREQLLSTRPAVSDGNLVLLPGPALAGQESQR
jgi:hypothetical protein